MNLVAGLYPALYDWLQEVPVEPGIPPGTCVTSSIGSLCSVTADIECHQLVESDCLSVTYPVIPKPELPVLVMACEIDVRQAVECETIDCRHRITSDDYVDVRYLEDVVEPTPVTMCADITARCLVDAEIAISCNGPKSEGVVAGISVRLKVTADLACCCTEMKS